MVISLLEGVERWLNAFPTDNIDQNSVSPATIIEGKKNPRDNISRIAYGSYTLVYTGRSNILNSRSTPAIKLRESNNNSGHYFMSLESGRRIHSNKWVEMPITDLQINRVHELATIGGTDYWLEDLVNHDIRFVEYPKTNAILYAISNHAPVTLNDENQAINERV